MSAEPSVSDSSLAPGSPLIVKNKNSSERPRAAATRAASSRASSVKFGRDRNRDQARGSSKVQPSSREESDEETVRPTKYVRLVDKKLTRVSRMSVCLFVCLRLCLFASLSLCLFVSLSLCLFMTLCLCLFASFRVCVCHWPLSALLYAFLSLFCLSICLFICSSVDLFVFFLLVCSSTYMLVC
jgi:hypothetical protein